MVPAGTIPRSAVLHYGLRRTDIATHCRALPTREALEAVEPAEAIQHHVVDEERQGADLIRRKQAGEVGGLLRAAVTQQPSATSTNGSTLRRYRNGNSYATPVMNSIVSRSRIVGSNCIRNIRTL